MPNGLAKRSARLALGATPSRLRGILLWQEVITVAAGAILGFDAALSAASFLQTLVESAKSIDSATFAFSVLFIVLIASISIWAATRRIAGLDIIDILRIE